MLRLIAFTFGLAFLAGCDTLGPGSEQTPPEAVLTHFSGGAGAAGALQGDPDPDSRSFREACSRDRTARLKFTRADGYQFVRRRALFELADSSETRFESYALGLDRVGQQSAALALYALSSSHPLVLQEKPVLARRVGLVVLTPGVPVAVVEIDQVLLWTQGPAGVGDGGAAGAFVVETRPVHDKDRVGDDDQRVPEVFVCPVPDLLGTIDLTHLL